MSNFQKAAPIPAEDAVDTVASMLATHDGRKYVCGPDFDLAYKIVRALAEQDRADRASQEERIREDERGEVERLTRERDEAMEREVKRAVTLRQRIDDMRCEIAETRKHLEKLLEAAGKARTALAGFTSADDAAFALDVAISEIKRLAGHPAPEPIPADGLVDAVAKAISRHGYTEQVKGDGFAWWWNSLHDHPGNVFAHECREDDRAKARLALQAIMQDRADRASQEERVREDERDRIYERAERHAAGKMPDANAAAAWLTREEDVMLPADRAHLRGDAS